MIRKIQIIFVFKTSRLWKIFTAFAYADIIGSTYIACRNKFLTKNKNISRTSRNVLLLLCAKTTIVICSKEQLLAMIFVTDNLVYRIYISSKFIANFHDVSRNLDRYSCRMKFPRYIEILTNDFWQCSFLLSVNLTLFFFFWNSGKLSPDRITSKEGNRYCFMICWSWFMKQILSESRFLKYSWPGITVLRT